MFYIFRTIVGFFQFLFDAIASLIGLVGMALSVFKSLFALLPAQVSVPAGVLLVVCVLYKVLGRESGG